MRLFCVILLAVHVYTFYINTTSHQFIDSDGRESFFRGLNVVYKKHPYYPILDHFDYKLSFSAEDMQLMSDLGFNIVRLGTQWPGVEPERGQINTTYINVLKTIIKDMDKYGLYALLDFHQDVLSRKFCGEGIPTWATFLKEGQPKQKFPYPIDDPYTVDESGVPSDADCARYDWSTYYFTEATGTAFQALYNNTAGIQDAFANFWKIIATEFRDIPNVIGYELINEPFAGDVIHRPDLILPGIADKVNLQPLYERISNDIRKIDTKKLIFFEPTTWSDFGSGFTQTPGGPEFQNRTVLAYHHYIPPDLSLEQSFMARMNDLNKLGCGGMLTEYDSSDNVNVWNETKRLIDFCNKLKQSWIGWEYKPLVPITGWGWGLWGQNGTFNTDLAKILSQTYAQRVCGQIALQYFDTETARYTLRYSLIPKCTAPTIIYTNEKLHYPKGYFVTVINGTWKQVAKKYIHVQPDGKGDVLVNLSRN